MTDNILTGVLGEYENNGYHDSDFYAVVWTGDGIDTILIDTTRGCMGRPKLVKATDDELLAAREWAANGPLITGPKWRDEQRIMEPGHANKGDRLRLLKDVKFTDKKRGGEPVHAKEGETGTVIWAGHFGTFYRNGYNRRGRHNLRVGLKFDDGRVIFTAMTNLRLDEEPKSEQEYAEQAERLSWTGCFADRSNAWMTWNHAAKRLPELQKELVQ